MISSICSFTLNNWFNYRTININNMYNFIYLTLDRSSDEEKKVIIKDMKMLIGMEFYTDFVKYIIKKNNNDNLLKFLQ
jgi:hypothetical protein